MTIPHSLPILLCLLLLSALVEAEVHKWTDADGVVHYSNKPPRTAPHGGVEEIATGSTAPARARASESGEAPPIPHLSETPRTPRASWILGDWQGCVSELCEKAKRIDPDCRHSYYCLKAKEFSFGNPDGSVKGRYERMAFEKELDAKLAAKTEPGRPMQPINRSHADRLSKVELTPAIRRMIEACRSKGAEDCDSEERLRYYRRVEASGRETAIYNEQRRYNERFHSDPLDISPGEARKARELPHKTSE